MSGESSESIRSIGVIDDHEATVRGLQVILEEASDLRFGAGAATVPELLTQDRRLDLVLLDLRLGDGSSPDANVELLHQAGIGVLVYTSGDEPYLIRRAAAAGVLGVLRKNIDSESLRIAVRQAASGEMVPTIDWAAALDSDGSFVHLPPQLRRVLELYAAGQSTPTVASTLDLSTETVRDYVDRIRRKYGDVGRPARTKTDLYKRALEDGWLPLPRPGNRPR